MTRHNTELRLDRLEAAEAIRHLKAEYARLCDSGYPPAEIAALFTEEGVWEAENDVGSHRGRDEIAAFFTGMSDVYTWAQHYMLTPRITVADDAQSAAGSWYLLMPCTIRGVTATRGAWLAGRYEDDYVKVDGVWKVAHMRLFFELLSPHEGGWVPTRIHDLTV
jgi:hypothetical protein